MEEEMNRRPRSSEEVSWRGTLLTQAALCLALYGAFNIGTPQESQNPRLMNARARRRELMDFYFLSVRGGFWPADEQSQLLQQMSRTAKLYEAKFVVNIGDLGEDDPLMQHASLHFPILKIPWYTTTAGNSTMALSGKSKKYFLKKIKIVDDQILDIIVIETGLFQDFPGLEEMKESESAQLHWMHQILSVTDRAALEFASAVQQQSSNKHNNNKNIGNIDNTVNRGYKIVSRQQQQQQSVASIVINHRQFYKSLAGRQRGNQLLALEARSSKFAAPPIVPRRIVVGFHPLMVCQEKHAQNSTVFYLPLHQIFLNYGVNAYLSQLDCAGQHYNIGGIAYLGNPGPICQEQIPFSENGDFNIVNERSVGFLLHRVTPLEIESYFINLAGMVVSKSKIHQQGRGVM